MTVNLTEPDSAPLVVAELMKAYDWSQFPCGEPSGWPSQLKHITSLMLETKFPMFLLWGDDLSMVYNDAYAPILGFKHPSALGQPFAVVWSEVWDQIGPIIAAAMAGSSSLYEDLPVTLNRNGSDEQTYFTFSYSPIRGENSDCVGVVCICHETTANVLLQQSRRSERDQLLRLFDQAPAFMALLQGPQHIYKMENAAYKDLIGHRDVVGKPVAEVIPEAVEQGFVAMLDEVYRSGTAHVGLASKFDVVRAPGRPAITTYIDFVCQPITNDSNQVIGILVQGYEVTDSYLAKQQLIEAANQKDRYIATLSHELRNPLAPIRTAARILQMPDLSPDVIAKAAGIIDRQSSQMATLLDDLLDIARISNNLVRLEKKILSVDSVIAMAIETARPLLESKHHQIIVQHQGAIQLEADEARLTQIVSNLVCNAAKYTNAAGMITIGSWEDDGECVITVSDNGIGIDENSLESIFDIFAQEEANISRSHNGLGIGLSIVKGLVELHGGEVNAYSEGSGKGAVFTVRLPCLPSTANPQKLPANHEPVDVAPLTILLADDNLDAMQTLATFLEIKGHQVYQAENGVDALKLADHKRPTVAILDIGMPLLNGHEVAKSLRQYEWGRSMYLIAATGWGTEEDVKKTSAAGFDAHLTKPFDLNNLQHLLANITQRYL